MIFSENRKSTFPDHVLRNHPPFRKGAADVDFLKRRVAGIHFHVLPDPSPILPAAITMSGKRRLARPCAISRRSAVTGLKAQHKLPRHGIGAGLGLWGPCGPFVLGPPNFGGSGGGGGVLVCTGGVWSLWTLPAWALTACSPAATATANRITNFAATDMRVSYFPGSLFSRLSIFQALYFPCPPPPPPPDS
jgi:hypothetical protein